MLVLEYIFKMYLCLDILSQNIRKSGFGASDELSSEEEEELQPVEVMPPLPHQERHPATTRPTSAPVSSVRKRNLKPNPKPTLRPQVIIKLFVNDAGVTCATCAFFFIYTASIQLLQELKLKHRQ